ncbi:hypothetical protein CMQ_2542 [Grosmannia clavigera kw1407]|uniref:Uncharacterized protein n=1 Tax=Grosmannia clavigera (strain kw1407 / UAMH 11150) TaxID=655863 RepID=F0XHF5_GROCL|nr:uncharacterized protein CMQ_2542 [Grosmannia clavigera kw1407]EFX02613.1 hypothetical protein CMQ_2542 [Grosmannia clavigera kw1407]
MAFTSSAYDAHVAALDHASITSTPTTANTSSDNHGGHGVTPSTGYYHAQNALATGQGHATAPRFSTQPDLTSSQGPVGVAAVWRINGSTWAPTSGLARNIPKWLLSAAVAGAAFVADSSVQQFRQVYEESIRVPVSAISAQKSVDSDVELMLLQATVLFQDIGLWSSEYAVMEITRGSLEHPYRWRSPLNKERNSGLCIFFWAGGPGRPSG